MSVPEKSDAVLDSRFMRALRMEPVDQTPIWIMRQAGRYLPEYRATRKLAGDFLTLCHTPELACEVTLQPLRRYALDAAIIFSDILVIPDAMGLGLTMQESVGPVFKHPITDANAVSKLGAPDPESDLGYVLDAVRTTRQALDPGMPLIGFSGSPWTLAVYMVEGRSKTDFTKVKAFAQHQPGAMHALLELLAQSVSAYLQAKAEAGASALMIFDTWGGILNTSEYHSFSLEYMSQIVHHLKTEIPDVPVILFTKGGGQWAKSIADTGCDAIGLDWTVDMGEVRKQLNGKVALQGNLEPDMLKSADHEIEQAAGKVLNSFGHGSGHIFNLGHGIKPDIDPEKVAVLVDAVGRLSRAYH